MNISQLQETWKKLLTPIFPQHAQVSWLICGNDIRLKVWWLLDNDPERPNKPSKHITIIVPSEVVDDYLHKPEARRVSDDQKLKQFVEQRFRMFRPNHDSPREAEPPIEQWIVDSG